MQQVISRLRQKLNLHFDFAKKSAMQQFPVLWDSFQWIKEQPREEWATHVKKIFGLAAGDIDTPVVETQWMAMLNFERDRQQTFVVGPHLQWGFERTEINISDFVKLPYDGQYFALPDCPYKLWGGPRTEWHQVQGVYVFRSHEHLVPGGLVRFYVWAGPNDKSFHPTDDASFFFGLTPVEFKSGGYSDMEDYFTSLLRDPLRDNSDSFAIAYPPEIRQEAYVEITKIMRVIINALVYLTTYQPKLHKEGPNEAKIAKLEAEMAKHSYNPEKNKYKRAKRKLDALQKGTITYLNLPIEARPPLGGTHASPIGHKVKGHYKMQAYDKRWKKHRLIWIDPYDKGDEDQMAPSRIYKGLENLT